MNEYIPFSEWQLWIDFDVSNWIHQQNSAHSDGVSILHMIEKYNGLLTDIGRFWSYDLSDKAPRDHKQKKKEEESKSHKNPKNELPRILQKNPVQSAFSILLNESFGRRS